MTLYWRLRLIIGDTIEYVYFGFTAKFVVSCSVFCKLWRNFGFFCSVNHLSGPLRTYMFTGMSSKGHGLWFVIGGFRSVLFVSGFKVRCFVIVLFWGNNRLVELALQVFLIFLIPVTCKNKATSASFLWQKIHSPSQFPSLFLSSLGSFSAKLGEHVTLWFALTPPSLKWLTDQKNPKSLRSLQYTQRDTMNWAVTSIPVWVSILVFDLYTVFSPFNNAPGRSFALYYLFIWFYQNFFVLSLWTIPLATRRCEKVRGWLQGCALRKIEGNLREIQGTQHYEVYEKN